jgi:GTP-binding protein
LLSRVTNARPKIANYHFTTLNPNLGVVDLAEGAGFVIADIPGIIEGASEGVGLGYEFLRHIERTKVIIHMVDGASVEGRDPIADIKAINEELEKYNPEILKRPQVIAANKMDTLMDDEVEDIISLLKEEFEPMGTRVMPISAVSGQGVKELLWHVNSLLAELPEEPVEFEQEYFPDVYQDFSGPITVTRSEEEEGVFLVEGPRVERMLGYTNLESEKGFAFFQNFMKENGVLDRLEELGIQEEDTVRVFYHEFDYYK